MPADQGLLVLSDVSDNVDVKEMEHRRYVARKPVLDATRLLQLHEMARGRPRIQVGT